MSQRRTDLDGQPEPASSFASPYLDPCESNLSFFSACLLFLRIFTEKSFGLLAARTTRGGGKSCHLNINKYATCKVVDITLAATPIH